MFSDLLYVSNNIKNNKLCLLTSKLHNLISLCMWYLLCRYCAMITLYLSSQLPVEVLTNVSMIIPVTVSTVTCVAVGGATRECGSGALPPVPTLVEGACQNVLKEVRGRCLR